MPLREDFADRAAGAGSGAARKEKPEPPFSLRLSAADKARLREEAQGAPLGTYMKAKLLGSPLPKRVRRSGLAVEDRRSLAQALALLGRSRVAANLNQLAYAANTGALWVSPDVERELLDAAREVRLIRELLLRALGMVPERAP